jgi:hypothetical protein
MKKYVLALLCVFGFTSLGMAQSSSVALKLGLPLLFSVSYGYDFEAPSKGFGVRSFLGATALGGAGIAGFGVEGLMRGALGDAGSSAFLGLGAAGILQTNSPSTVFFGSSGVYVYLLAGFEFTLGKDWGFLLEWQPIQVFTGPSGLSVQTIPYIALGVNYRF